MATIISSEDGQLLLSKLRDEQTSVEIFCSGTNSELFASLSELVITELSGDTVWFSDRDGRFRFKIFLRGRSFRYLEPREIPDEIFDKSP